MSNSEMTKLSDADLMARMSSGSMEAVQEYRRRLVAQTMGGATGDAAGAPGQPPIAARPQTTPNAAAQIPKAAGAQAGALGALVGQAMGTTARAGNDPRAAACIAAQKEERSPRKIAADMLAHEVVSSFDRANNPRGFAAVLYVLGMPGGRGPINVVDPEGPWKARVEPLDAALKRTLDYDSGFQTRPRDEEARMQFPLQPIRRAGDSYVAPMVVKAAPAAPEGPPPSSSAVYRLGAVDLNSTMLVSKNVDRSRGASNLVSTFEYLKPSFSSDNARVLYEKVIDQPMDPAYYANNRWKSNFTANALRYRADIEALPPAEQAQVLGNLVLWLRWRLEFGENAVFAFLKQFPQLQDIEFTWMRPRYDGNGQVLAIHGEFRRGNVFDFLTSAVAQGTPDERKEYPRLADVIPPANVDSIRRHLATAR